MSVRYVYDRATGTELVLCLSTDSKPASANGVGLVEQDTGKLFYRVAGAWVAPNELQLSRHVTTANFTVTDGHSATISRYVEVGSGFTVTIGADSDLEVA